MPTNRNIGRKSHMAQDNELAMNQPAVDAADVTGQDTRPTQHPQQGTKSRAQQPLQRHTRRGD